MPRGVGKTAPVHRYSVDMFSYSGPSGILGSGRRQSTAQAVPGGVKIVGLSIISYEQTQ